MPEPTAEEIARLKPYSDVLMFMHWAMSQPEGKNIPMGELLTKGCQVFNLPHPDHDIEQTILTAAFKLAGNDVPFTTVVA